MALDRESHAPPFLLIPRWRRPLRTHPVKSRRARGAIEGTADGCPWYKDGAFYKVEFRAFCDSNASGIVERVSEQGARSLIDLSRHRDGISAIAGERFSDDPCAPDFREQPH